MTDTTKHSQVAMRAASIVAERGHCKWQQEDDLGRVCLAGALSIAMFGETPSFAAINLIIAQADEVAREQFPDRIEKPENAEPDWYNQGPSINMNNHPLTQPEEVIALLEKTAVRLMEMGQ